MPIGFGDLPAHEDVVMTLKFPVVKLAVLLAAVAAGGVDATTSNAQSPQYDHNGHLNYGPGGPNVSYQQGPHTRLYVPKRSWLDAGTEVLPGDRKYTDYAFPSAIGFPTFARARKN